MATVATREVGRPRIFGDEAIFGATAAVLAKVGHERTTLTAIAEEVGCSAPALVQRFGSKRMLVRSFIEWSIQRNAARWHRVEAMYESPLAAIRARVQMPRSERPDELSDPEGFPSTVFFHLAAWEDPTLRPLVDARRQNIEQEIEKLLDLAQTAGEIGHCNSHQLAKLLSSAFSGAALHFLSAPDRPIEDELVDLFDVMIAPYRIAAK